MFKVIEENSNSGNISETIEITDALETLDYIEKILTDGLVLNNFNITYSLNFHSKEELKEKLTPANPYHINTNVLNGSFSKYNHQLFKGSMSDKSKNFRKYLLNDLYSAASLFEYNSEKHSFPDSKWYPQIAPKFIKINRISPPGDSVLIQVGNIIYLVNIHSLNSQAEFFSAPFGIKILKVDYYRNPRSRFNYGTMGKIILYPEAKRIPKFLELLDISDISIPNSYIEIKIDHFLRMNRVLA